MDAIVQVVRCFDDSDIHHVSGSIDPIRDIEIINTELVLADLTALQKRKERLAKAVRVGDKVAKTEMAIIEKLLPHLDTGKPAITLELSDDEKKVVREFFLLSSKPTLFACNVAESDLSKLAAGDSNDFPAAQHVKAVQEYVGTHLATEAVVISAQIESELVGLSDEEAAEYLQGIGVSGSGAGSLIRSVYHLLGLRTYLTTGEQETRAWTIHAGDKAPAAAGVIHSDFERGFIAAETVHYDDLIKYGSFAKAREAGRLRIEGKEYVMQDGDVVDFRFNV